MNGPHELPCLAEAADQDLIRWTRDPGNPVIASPPPGEAVRAFRDHSAWRNGPVWYQVVGGGLDDRGGALFLYRSADLRTWEYVGVIAAAADHGLDGAIWECPDVFVLGDTDGRGGLGLRRSAAVGDVDDRQDHREPLRAGRRPGGATTASGTTRPSR